MRKYNIKLKHYSSIVKKVIALWLVFIMLMVPFLFNIDSNIVKAEPVFDTPIIKCITISGIDSDYTKTIETGETVGYCPKSFFISATIEEMSDVENYFVVFTKSFTDENGTRDAVFSDYMDINESLSTVAYRCDITDETVTSIEDVKCKLYRFSASEELIDTFDLGTINFDSECPSQSSDTEILLQKSDDDLNWTEVTDNLINWNFTDSYRIKVKGIVDDLAGIESITVNGTNMVYNVADDAYYYGITENSTCSVFNIVASDKAGNSTQQTEDWTFVAGVLAKPTFEVRYKNTNGEDIDETLVSSNDWLTSHVNAGVNKILLNTDDEDTHFVVKVSYYGNANCIEQLSAEMSATTPSGDDVSVVDASAYNDDDLNAYILELDPMSSELGTSPFELYSPKLSLKYSDSVVDTYEFEPSTILYDGELPVVEEAYIYGTVNDVKTMVECCTDQITGVTEYFVGDGSGRGLHLKINAGTTENLTSLKVLGNTIVLDEDVEGVYTLDIPIAADDLIDCAKNDGEITYEITDIGGNIVEGSVKLFWMSLDVDQYGISEVDDYINSVTDVTVRVPVSGNSALMDKLKFKISYISNSQSGDETYIPENGENFTYVIDGNNRYFESTITIPEISVNDLTMYDTKAYISIMPFYTEGQAYSLELGPANFGDAGKIVYDMTPPSGTARLMVSHNGSNYTEATKINGIYQLYNYSTYTYKVEANNVSDDNLESINTVLVNDETADYIAEGVYSKIVSADAIINNSIPVQISDKAGNTKDINIPVSIFELDDTLDVDIVVRNSSNGAVDFNRIQIYDNEIYTVTIEACSPGSINTSAIYTRLGESKGIEIETDEYETIDGINRYQGHFTIPASAYSTNQWLKDISITVSDDVLTHTPVVKTLSEYLYDQTKPIVTINNQSELWVNSVSAELNITDITALHEESGILVYYYSIKNGDNNMNYTGDNNLLPSPSYSIPESDTIEGTTISVYAQDKAGNISNIATTTYYVDMTEPEVTEYSIEGSESFAIPLPLKDNPEIKFKISDNLSIQKVDVIVSKPDGTTQIKTFTYHNVSNNASESLTTNLGNLLGVSSLPPNGVYKVQIVAYDEAGNQKISNSQSIIVDNTAPVVKLFAVSGTTADKQPVLTDGVYYDSYYSSDVTVTFDVTDNQSYYNGNVSVTDNGKQVMTAWAGSRVTILSGEEGIHKIVVTVTDDAGNVTEHNAVSFIIDKTAPVITTTFNDKEYTEVNGTRYFTTDVTSNIVVFDENLDTSDFHIDTATSTPDVTVTSTGYVNKASGITVYTEEKDYMLTYYAVDMAGNSSLIRTALFRIDKTAPSIKITGATGGVQAATAGISLDISDIFWSDTTGTYTIYRKAGDGQDEVLFKETSVTPTAFKTTVSETLSEVGEYRIEFTATDKTGNTAQTNATVIVDPNKPVITLTGVSNYDVTSEDVEFSATITEEFYIEKIVTIEGTRVDDAGEEHDIDFADFQTSADPTSIFEVFTEDGIYDIKITSTDTAGNKAESLIHFTIDKSKPVIMDLSGFEGKVLSSFRWNYGIDDIVNDLTVCDVKLFLNGAEYDGSEVTEDGSYTLRIVATDELGNEVEKEISFVLDTKGPAFLVTGVENGDSKKEKYSINISLQLDEDTLDSVTLNGEIIQISDNMCTFEVTEAGEYELVMKSHDEAGNVSEQTISFTYEDESNALLIVLMIVAVLAVLGGVIFVAMKSKKKSDK